jgi:uncharacterized metal-binding protein
MSDEKSCACQTAPKLVFACCGAADVGALTDQAARSLSRHKTAKMYCLAGIGGKVPDIIENTKTAEKIVALDGCDTECCRHTLIEGGFKDFIHVRLLELGFKKGETAVSKENIDKIEAKVRELI